MNPQPLTPAEARKDRELAEQRLAFAFDAKTNAEAHLLRMKTANAAPHVIADAEQDVELTRKLYADALAAAEQAARVEREVTARRGGRR